VVAAAAGDCAADSLVAAAGDWAAADALVVMASATVVVVVVVVGATVVVVVVVVGATDVVVVGTAVDVVGSTVDVVGGSVSSTDDVGVSVGDGLDVAVPSGVVKIVSDCPQPGIAQTVVGGTSGPLVGVMGAGTISVADAGTV